MEKIEGIVKIVRKGELTMVNDFKENVILVSIATSPDYIQLMKKAIAIITDEGGLISHAAIVSRELNKPCIVQTKIATSVLKDGDKVEIDLLSGIIKKK